MTHFIDVIMIYVWLNAKAYIIKSFHLILKQLWEKVITPAQFQSNQPDFILKSMKKA
jgi:hypothetical protein